MDKFEEKIHSDLQQYLLSVNEIDERLVKIMRLDRCAYIETKLFALNIPDETRKRPIRSLLCCSTRTLACAKAHVTTGKALVKHFRLALRSPHKLKFAGTPK